MSTQGFQSPDQPIARAPDPPPAIPLDIRDQARRAVGVYQTRTGMSLKKLAEETGYSYYTMRHLSSGADYSTDGPGVALAALEFIRAHPPMVHEHPGVRYETTATRKVDSLVRYCYAGCLATFYGPTGSQKTYELKWHAAQGQVLGDRGQRPIPSLLWHW